MCENSYIVSNCDNSSKAFQITSDMREVIIIEGELRCSATKEHFSSPVVIPHYIKRLVLTKDTTKLLVISNSQSPITTILDSESEVFDTSTLNKLISIYEKLTRAARDAIRFVVGLWNRVLYQEQCTLPVIDDDHVTSSVSEAAAPLTWRNIATDTSLRDMTTPSPPPPATTRRAISLDTAGSIPKYVAMETIAEFSVEKKR